MLRKCVSSVLHQSVKNGGSKNLVKYGSVALQDQRRYGTIGEAIQRFRFKFMFNTRHHLDNDIWAKIFAVEGNIGVGKTEFAEQFAKKLDLKFFPSTSLYYSLDRLRGEYADEYIDFIKSPESVHQAEQLSFDYFTKEPSDWIHTGRYRLKMQINRYMQYCDALAYLLETGRGVTTIRTFYSDSVIAEAQRRMGWLRQDVFDFYDLQGFVADEHLLHPQVVFYLDMPASLCYENVQKNGCELDKRLPLEYFMRIEEAYKRIYLPKARDQGVNVIELDWTDPISLELLIENLEDMEDLNAPTSVWLLKENVQFQRVLKWCRDIHGRLEYLREIYLPVEELWQDPDIITYHEHEIRACPFSAPKGLNPSLGDKNIWLKDA